MPSYSAFAVSKVAKPGVCSDGDIYQVGADGYTITGSVTGTSLTAISSYSAFLSPPVYGGSTGLFSITLRDPAYKVQCIVVETLSGDDYLSVQLKPITADSNGRAVINFVLNVAGTPTNLESGDQMLVYVVYSETSVA
jgi:hypothetical protein